MPLFVGPSHHVFFGALYRRYLWLRQLGAAFDQFAISNFATALRELNRNHRASLRPFHEIHRSTGIGIARPLNLRNVLDDTPVESFLSQLANNLSSYEDAFFCLFPEHGPRDIKWQKSLEQTSTLWGREVGGECLLSPNYGLNLRETKNGVIFNFNELFELYLLVFNGGDSAWNSLLLWRSTTSQLLYELRTCPHQAITNVNAAHLACHLEGKVFKGFAQALVPKVSFERRHSGTYCRDELFLR